MGAGKTAVGEVIRKALVLCADHELNVSAFTARCAASAAASPYDMVSAAMATLKGGRHGGESERVLALMAEVGTPGRARAVVANRLRRGDRLPGFGHPALPRRRSARRGADASGRSERQSQAVEPGSGGGWRASEAVHDLPNLDFGLVALAPTYGLPDSAPLVLFAIGRTVGWIAHAIEQYASGELIRPRANYTGPAPPTE